MSAALFVIEQTKILVNAVYDFEEMDHSDCMPGRCTHKHWLRPALTTYCAFLGGDELARRTTEYVVRAITAFRQNGFTRQEAIEHCSKQYDDLINMEIQN